MPLRGTRRESQGTTGGAGIQPASSQPWLSTAPPGGPTTPSPPPAVSDTHRSPGRHLKPWWEGGNPLPPACPRAPHWVPLLPSRCPQSCAGVFPPGPAPPVTVFVPAPRGLPRVQRPWWSVQPCSAGVLGDECQGPGVETMVGTAMQDATPGGEHVEGARGLSCYFLQ